MILQKEDTMQIVAVEVLIRWKIIRYMCIQWYESCKTKNVLLHVSSFNLAQALIPFLGKELQSRHAAARLLEGHGVSMNALSVPNLEPMNMILFAREAKAFRYVNYPFNIAIKSAWFSCNITKYFATNLDTLKSIYSPTKERLY